MWQFLPMSANFSLHLPSPPLPTGIIFPLVGEEKTVNIAGGKLAEGYRQKDNAIATSLLEMGSRRLLLLEFSDCVKIFGETQENIFYALLLCLWCRQKAGGILPAHCLELAAGANEILAGATIAGIAVRDQSSRWGSCSVRRKPGQSDHATVRIHLNWRALLLPSILARHLFWHELCHICHPNHGNEFKKLLAKQSPGAVGHEKALGAAWRAMPAWALTTLTVRGLLKISNRRRLH